MPTYFIMPMEKFLFLDLDDTVFQTKRKCNTLANTAIASYNLKGEASSYFSAKQVLLMQGLSEQWRIIPTTARTQASYARVNLGLSCHEGAILNHGGTVLLNDGLEDKTWQTHIKNQLIPLTPLLTQLQHAIQQYAISQYLDILVRITHESDCDFYIEVRHKHANNTELSCLLVDYIQPLLSKHPDFEAYLNGNSLTILPHCINKSHAVTYKIEALKQQYGDILTMGFGDSLTDLAFMAHCDYTMLPKQSQNYQKLMS